MSNEKSPKNQYEPEPHPDPEAEGEDKRELWWILGGAVLFAVSEILEHTGVRLLVTLPLDLLAYLILGAEILRTAAKNLIHGQIFDENFLMSIATLGAFAIGEYPEAVGVMLFYRIGEYLEDLAEERSRSQILQAVDLRPETVNLLSGDEVRVLPAGEAKVGDLLLVRPGDRIPLDGIVQEGESRLDTSAVTGEPVPVRVQSGDPVTSGCINTTGQLILRVEKPLGESMVTRILNSVENAAAGKPKIDRFITRFARVYTPIVVILALCTAVIPSLFTGQWHHWIYTALTFLVISCPCALVLSVPLSFFCGIGAGSRRGILFKDGIALEQLAAVRAVVLDKTGTVTQGDFAVQDIVPAGSYTADELLTLAAGAEEHSTHPIAVSIAAAAEKRNLSPGHPSSLEETPGHGICASLDGREVLCGNRKLLESRNIDLSGFRPAGFGSEVLLAVDGTFAGHLVLSDTIRPDAAAAVARIKQYGLATAMLTGDAPDAAGAVAAAAGIEEVSARLLPEEKRRELARIREEHGSVLFVGDGINDAPVLAGADVGAAMGSGADAAIEAADLVIMNTKVCSIPDAIGIARRANRISRENVVFALSVKILIMLFGLLGHVSMWLAVFADTGVALLCVLNSIRVLYRYRT